MSSSVGSPLGQRVFCCRGTRNEEALVGDSRVRQLDYELQVCLLYGMDVARVSHLF